MPNLKIWTKNKQKQKNLDESQPLRELENGKKIFQSLEDPSASRKRTDSMTSDTRKWEPRNRIHQYAFENNVEGIKSLLNEHPDQEFLEVNKADSGDTRYCLYPLHYAAMGHSADAARALIVDGADMNKIKTSMCFLRPFHISALYGEWVTRTGKTQSIDEIFDVFHKNGHMKVDHASLTGSTALHFACLRNNFQLAKRLIEAGANVNACESSSLVTPLHLASEYNAPEIVRMLLEKGADVFCIDSAGNTALHYAARCDNVEIVKMIVDKSGHDELFLCQKNKRSCTALQLAIEHNRQSIAEYLLEKHKKLSDLCSTSDSHLLHIAARKGYTTIVALLVKHGWNLESRDKDGRMPFHIAGLYNQVEVINELIALNTTMEAWDNFGYTPLLGAASKDNLEAFKVLWNWCLVTAVSFFGDSVLMIAVKNNSMGCIKFMLAEQNHTKEIWDGIKQMTMLPNLNIDTPLHIVCTTGNLDTFNLLIPHYIDINMRNFNLQTPLHLAVQHGHTEIVQRLLDISSCSINLRDNLQNTPLFLAVQKNNVRMITILLDNGANIMVENFMEQIPLDIAIKEGNMDVIEILLKRQPDDDLKMTRRKVYPLHYAIKNKQLAVIRMLLDKSYYTDIALVNDDGLTCMDLAIQERYEEGVLALLDTNREEWKKVMRRRPEQKDNESPIQQMIKFMPNMAVHVFDKCIYNMNPKDSIERHEYEFLDDVYVLPDEVAKLVGTTCPFDFNGNLRPEAKQRSPKYETIIETHPLSIMVKEKRFDLLSHDLVESYLSRKWNGFTKWFYYSACFFYLIFVAFLSHSAINLPPPVSTNETETHYAESKCLLPNSKPYILFGYIIILLLLMVFKFWRYYKSYDFILEKLLEVTVCVLALPLSVFCSFFSGYTQWTLLLIVNFIAWINLLNYIRKLPRFGVYVLMVWSTIATFLRFSPIFVLFLLPFSVTFHVLLGDAPGLINLLRRFLHTMVFLIGEFDYESNIASSPFTLTYVMFFLYLLVGTVFLMNLLVGLAVSDTNEAMEKATKTRIGLEVDMILHVESSFPLAIRRMMTVGYRTIKRNRAYNVLYFLKELTRWFGLTKNALRREKTNKEPLSVIPDMSQYKRCPEKEVDEKLSVLTAQMENLHEQIRAIQNATENIASIVTKNRISVD